MGLVGGSRRYDEAGGPAPMAWTCPGCGTEHVSIFEQGCPACGAGTPGQQIVPPRPTPVPAPALPRPHNALMDAALAWVNTHPRGSTIDAFLAGYMAAQAQTLRAAAPVTADLASLAPSGKEARTILAALRLFRDQVLRDAAEEIDSGEFCSLDETHALITRIEESL